MKALLLAAGLGTRLRPLTDTTPKCLVRIRGRPLLDYWLDLLLGQNEVERVLINTHHLTEIVREHIRRSRWRDRIEVADEASLLGTGGTILRNRKFFAGQTFMVAHADNLTCFELHAFIASHATRPVGTLITMMTFETDAPESCGVVEVNEQGVVMGFHEKIANPPGNRANGAVYLMEPAVIGLLESLNKEVIDLSTEILPALVGRMYSYHNTVYHRDIGTLSSLAEAESSTMDFSRGAIARALPPQGTNPHHARAQPSRGRRDT